MSLFTIMMLGTSEKHVNSSLTFLHSSENTVLFNIEKRDTQMSVALLFYPYHSPKSQTQPSIFGKKNFTKIVTQNVATGIDACGRFKRRTRSLPTPHAELAISPREADQPRRRNFAEKYAVFNRRAHGVCIFFALRCKFRPRKPPIIGKNAI